MKKRAAITIIYNGLHHLKHRDFVRKMMTMFDYWVIVEGASANGGSTSWCRKNRGLHRSTDGTAEYIKAIEKICPNVRTYSHHKHYKSKDEQFNKGIVLLKTMTDNCWLWQVDADEHWSERDLADAERKLWRSTLNVASFQFNHYVGKDIIAVGDWGSGRVNRLWKWKGQLFRSHEPSVMETQTIKELKLPQKFEHYSMVFDQDVRFKSQFYPGHNVYHNWVKLGEVTQWPAPITTLFDSNTEIGRSDTMLHKINKKKCVNVQNQDGLKVAADLKC